MAVTSANPQEAEQRKPSKESNGEVDAQEELDEEKPPRELVADVPAWRRAVAKALCLRHHEDIRTCCIVGFTWVLFGSRWHFRHAELPLVLNIISWWTVAIWSWFCATIVHNCVHVAQFEKTWQNQAWQLILTLSYGFPVSTLVPGHNLSHHKHTQGPKDVIRTSKMRWGWNLLNLLFLIPTIFYAIQVQDHAYMKKQQEKKRPIFKQACREVALFFTVQLAFLLWDWKSYILFVAAPQAFAKVGIISINLPQHDGCPGPEENKYNCARNFTGLILNYFTCNNGYHTIHHMYPGMHWTQVIEAHERLVKPKMHPNLDQPNLLWYLFVTYVLPGGRKMYDGSPYVMPVLEEDQPWYTEDTLETYSTKVAGKAE
mmetsp:Transcript_36659/g.66272  ORF Transcript_36659/g.66272 Transcript_36659/m.66272 type:complete len:372 (-) Transcript_36659:61-1176(-)